ncbi:MAG: hypothetical protein SPJ79_07420, partial [Prevotella sp.]|nr:hypothetical protein [Bacteroidales bacterium]MDY5877401.1 hypothetical protein [Prevotella sp.]
MATHKITDRNNNNNNIQSKDMDIRELNIRIEQESGFVQNLTSGMDKVIIGQKHLVDSLLISL